MESHSYTHEAWNGAGPLLPAQHLLRVLIAEKHLLVAQTLQQVVGTLGMAEVTVTVSDPKDVLESAHSLQPDVAIVDLDLSPSCGLISQLHARFPELRIIVMIDPSTDPDLVLRALESGAGGALYKDTSLEELKRALASSSRVAPMIPGHATGLLLTMYLDSLHDKRERDLATIEALAAAVEVRDATTGDHLHRVSTLAAECMTRVDPALALNDELTYGFMLHDIGKIGVPDSILNKPAALNPQEWDVMRKHPEMGVRIVEPLGFSSTAMDVILSHHERWDGKGYPNGLDHEEIPIGARVFSIVDAYDAMTSDRPYRAAMEPDVAIDLISDLSGHAYDPDLVEVFVDVVA